MNSFFITLTAVAIMLFYAIPGYILIKRKQIDQKAIPAFANVLMYVCQPCLTIYSVSKVAYSISIVKDIAVVLIFSIILQLMMLLLFYMVFKKKKSDVKYRVCTIATTLGNCAFMGVPLLEAIMPDNPEAIVMSTSFCVGMNLIGWTVASAIITDNKKYMSIKKAIFNPAVLSLIVAIPLFITGTNLPNQLNDMVTILGKMSTPMCMLIMGMRLATVELKSIFTDKLQYLIVIIKQILMPLIAILLFKLLPVDDYLIKTMFILCATPIASVVLNFAEMLGEGQKTAANLVLLGTLSSILTIPIMMLIL